MANDKVLCANCKWLRTDGPLDQWYHYCGLDKDKPRGERMSSWYERAGNERMRDKLDGSCEMGEVDRHNMDRLRNALNEVGIKWRSTTNWADAYCTSFRVGPLSISVDERDNGSLGFFVDTNYAELDADDVIGLVDAIRGAVNYADV